MLDIATLPRHPLHHAVLESFLDLKDCPEPQQARFTSTLTRVLLDGLVTDQDLDHAPQFLIDPGIRILRLDLDIHGEISGGPNHQPICEIHTDFRSRALISDTPSPLVTRCGDLVLCEPLEDFTMLAQCAMDEGVSALGFVDPVYEDSLIVVDISEAACRKWMCSGSADRKTFRLTA